MNSRDLEARVDAADLCLRHDKRVEDAEETLERVMQDAEGRGLDDLADAALAILMRHEVVQT
jgi:hypothetical protein